MANEYHQGAATALRPLKPCLGERFLPNKLWQVQTGVRGLLRRIWPHHPSNGTMRVLQGTWPAVRQPGVVRSEQLAGSLFVPSILPQPIIATSSGFCRFFAELMVLEIPTRPSSFANVSSLSEVDRMPTTKPVDGRYPRPCRNRGQSSTPFWSFGYPL